MSSLDVEVTWLYATIIFVFCLAAVTFNSCQERAHELIKVCIESGGNPEMLSSGYLKECHHTTTKGEE